MFDKKVAKPIAFAKHTFVKSAGPRIVPDRLLAGAGFDREVGSFLSRVFPQHFEPTVTWM